MLHLWDHRLVHIIGVDLNNNTVNKSLVSRNGPTSIDSKKLNKLSLYLNEPNQAVPCKAYLRNNEILSLGDMLDQGDGIEYDINARKRNQQWMTIPEPAKKRRKLHEPYQEQFMKMTLQQQGVGSEKVKARVSTIGPKVSFTNVIDALKETKTSHIASDLKARYTKSAGLAYGSNLVCLLSKRDC